MTKETRYIKKQIEVSFPEDFKPVETFNDKKCLESGCPFLEWSDDYEYGACCIPNPEITMDGLSIAFKCPIRQFF